MNELIAYIDEKESEMVEFLKTIVNIDSGSLYKAGVDQVGTLLAERLSTLGFTFERIPQIEYGDHLIGRKPGKTSKRILFLGHMDTVFPAGTVSMRPFRIESNRAYGPGVRDMKGGIVCLLYALEALKATGHPSYDLITMTTVFNSDEELLSPTSRGIIENEARQANTVCVFEPARPGGEYVTCRKGVGKYTLTVKGRASHAGNLPERGRSAIVEIAHKVIAFHGLTDFAAGVTLNVGVIHGGERSNIVAEKAYAEIDLRVPNLDEAERMDNYIREVARTCWIPDTTAELSGGLMFPPMEETAQTRSLFEAVQEAGRGLGLDLCATSAGGGSDGNCASQFAPTIDGMGPQGNEGHTSREFIELPTLTERSKVTALFLASWPEVFSKLQKGV